MKQIIFGIKYIIDHELLNKNTPLICGLVMHNKCNLRCRHCRITERKAQKLTFDEAKSVIDSFYQEGGRTLYLQGGEPFLWKQDSYTIEDVVLYSRQAGFFSTIIYTNGTFPLSTSADTVFVSMDGLEAHHNYLRGDTFNQIINNIVNSDHNSIYMNFTINNINKNEIKEFCRFIDNIDQIKGVFFYFHTPYYGYDDLYIEQQERHEILQKLIEYEKSYKILNSHAGLKSALHNDWRRPLNVCRVQEKNNSYTCCRFPDNAELCRNCGYLSYAEIDQTLKLKPSAIGKALKYF